MSPTRATAAPATEPAVEKPTAKPPLPGAAGKAKGTPATAELVELYRVLHAAGHPLRFDEITEALPGEYRSHAYREFRADLTDKGVPVKEDKWTEREKQTAWRWWVDTILAAGILAKHLTAEAPDGSKTRGRTREELVYSANPSKPPLVIESVTENRVVPWTPTIGDTGRRHAAGMAFLQDITGVLAAPKIDPEKARELLELAEKAIRT